jgi:3-hydroxyacyl-[acyl-carrier-protein] dehydratase
MLQPDFYSFIRIVSNGSSSLEASFLLNPKHAIFAGHFPGQPVVPGVCMLQIIKEGLEQALDVKLFFAKAASIKFLSMLVPIEGQEISLQADFNASGSGEIIVSNASLSYCRDNFIKLSNACYFIAPVAG